jgi:2-iminobutanoate/2-iminopropanoate deaminase
MGFFIFPVRHRWIQRQGNSLQARLQTRPAQCFKNLFAVLETAGLTSDDVIKVQVYLTEMNDFEAMNEIYAKQFSKPYPARTTIGCASLPLNAKIEIGMIAKTR